MRGSSSEIKASRSLSYVIFTGFGLTFPLATFAIVAFSSSRPWPLLAAVATTGMPKRSDNLSSFSEMFFLLASSIRFTHNITRLVISVICRTRFRFLSRQVASATTTVASGLPKQIKSLASSSSTELAKRE